MIVAGALDEPEKDKEKLMVITNLRQRMEDRRPPWQHIKRCTTPVARWQKRLRIRLKN